jgi:hypothetical protein
MRSAELIYFRGCPHVDAARTVLERAFSLLNRAPQWTEYQTDDPALPAHARGYGSPTILVDGHDVTGVGGGGSASSCRLYRDEQGRPTEVPRIEQVVAALAGERS